MTQISMKDRAAVVVPGTGERSFARYQVLRMLGQGGMGAVYVAYDPQLDRRVALKVVSPSALGLDDEQESWALLRAQLRGEARALALLAHPNVCTLYDIGIAEEHVFLTMELIEGDTLRTWARRTKRHWRDVVAIMHGAGLGLAAAHAVSLAHLDFKPENVMVANSGRAIVLDFGIAQLFDRVPSSTTAYAPEAQLGDGSWAAGTPAYMAPEQFNGQGCDAQADQFAYCLTMYELVYGVRPPRHGVRVLVDAPPSMPGVPRALFDVLCRGLARDPACRYPSMAALLAALAGVRESADRRREHFWIFVGLTGVVALVMALWFAQRHDPCPPAEGQWADVWNEHRRVHLQTAFASTGAPSAGAAYVRVSEHLANYVDTWLGLQVRTCREVRVSKTLGGVVLDRRMRCLRQARQRVDATLEQFLAADRGLVEQAPRIVYELPKPQRCVEIGVSSAEEVVPAHAGAEELEQRLLEVEVSIRTGRPHAALERAQDLVNADGLSQSMRAVLQQHMGDAHRQLEDPERAVLHHRRALLLAIAGGRREAAARAAIDLVFEAGYLQSDVGQAKRWLAEARAFVRATSDAPEHYAAYLAEHALVRSMESDQQGYETFLRAALRVYEQEFEDADPRKTVVIHDIGVAKLFQHAWADAVPLFRQAIDRHEQLFGPIHPEVAVMYSNLGEALANSGQLEHGLTAYRHGLHVCERVAGPVAITCAIQRAGAATVLSDMGWFSQAMEQISMLETAQRRAGHRGRPEVLPAATMRALVELQRGRLVVAAGAAAEGFAQLQADVSGRANVLARALRVLARVELKRGEHRLVRGRIAAANDLLVGEAFDGRVELAEWLRLEGDLELAVGDIDLAVRRHSEAYHMHVDAMGEGELATVEFLLSSAASWAKLRATDQVLTAVKSAEALFTDHLGPGHPRHADLTIALAERLRTAGLDAAADAQLARAESTMANLRPALVREDPIYFRYLTQRARQARFREVRPAVERWAP